MIISARHNFVFVKTRKTAGTSIEVFLASCIEPSAVATPINPPEDGHQARNYLADPSSQGSALRFWNHMPAWQIRDELCAEAWETYRTFCVERNPWDQVISAYSMLRRRGNPDLSWEDYLASGDFFLNHQLYTEPDDPSKIIVDDVVLYEELSDGLRQIFADVAIRFEGDLGVRAKGDYRTDRRHYRNWYSEDQAALVAAAFANEISLFGYEF